MTSEIRANIIKNRVGLGTIEYSNTGPVISGVTTASNFKTGTSNLHSTGLNIQDLDVDGHTNLDNVSIAGITTVNGGFIFDNGTNAGKDLQWQPSNNRLAFFNDVKATFGNTVDLQIYHNSTENHIYGSTNKPIIFSTNTDERLRITSTGRVGIGTDNPSGKLDIVTGTLGGNVLIDAESSSGYHAKIVNDSGDLTLGSRNTNADTKLTSKRDVIILTGSSEVEKLRIKSSGNVGIGTDNPDEDLVILDVSPSLKLTSTSTVGNTNIYFGDAAGTTQGQIQYHNNGDFFRFFTNGSNERLRIGSDGKVGVGTNLSSSTYKLEVWDDSAATFMIRKGNSSRIVFSNDSQHNTIYSQALPGYTGRAFSVYIGSSEAIRINSSRKVGLGTTGSDYMLSIREADNNNKWLMLQKNSGQQLLQIREDGNNHVIIDGSHASGELHFYTAGSERLRVTSNGIIGAGGIPIAASASNGVGNAGTFQFYHVNTSGNNAAAGKIQSIATGAFSGSTSTWDADLVFSSVLNSTETERLRITSDGKVGINQDNPDTQLVVVTDGLDDNTLAFKTSYRSGNNASGYTASGITIVSSANDSNGDQNTAYLQFSNRSPALNGSHGASAFITMSTPDAQGTYGTGEFNFYCRNGSAYTFPNDPAVGSSYWMSSLFKIKSTGELFGYGNLRIDTGSNADGIIGAAYGTSYFGIKQADQGASEYMMISNNNHTYISCTSGNSIYIRPSANSQTHETLFAHDNTTFKTNVVLDSHALRRNQHQWGHMEGGHNNIGSTNVKTSPIYTIGSAYNPNENDLNNMYGIGYCHSDASFINSNVTGGWGQYVASDGDARIFLNAGDGVVYANRYGRVAHNSGHLQGSYNNVGANSAQSNPIYTIGSSYNPAASTLSNMYGVGYSHGNNASFLSFSGLTGWGLYVAADGDARMFLDASTGKIAATGTITGSASDVRLKTNIKVIDNPIEKIKKIRGVTFDWVDNITSEYDFHPDSMHETGVIAQEIQEVIPDAVATAPFNGNYTRKSGTDNNYLTVKNEKIIPLCIEAIKKLTAKVESLEQENTALKARVTSLEE